MLDGLKTTVLHSDIVLLQFDVRSPANHEDERISMLLRPTEDLIHPDARIVYTTTDPLTGISEESTEKLAREDVLAYTGYVLREDQVQAKVMESRIGLRTSNEATENRGWARVVLSHDEYSPRLLAEGAFLLDGEIHHLKSLNNWKRSIPDSAQKLYVRQVDSDSGLILLRDRDLDAGTLGLSSTVKRQLGSTSCSHDFLAFNRDPNHPIYQNARQIAFDATYGRPTGWLNSWLGMGDGQTRSHSYSKRQSSGDIAGGSNVSSNYINSIGSHTGCPKSKKVLYMGLASDCTYVSTYGSVSQARTQLLTNINSVSAVYQQTFDISLGVIELNVPDANCPTSANGSLPWNVGCPEGGPSGLVLNDRLSAFSTWRGAKGGSDGGGLWHLMTNCSTDQEVGVAWLGSLCKVSTSVSSDGGIISGTAVTAVTPREWQVMAHEIGHNFGAVHDCADNCTLTGVCCPLSTTTCDGERTMAGDCSPANFLRLALFLASIISFTANAAYIMSPVSEQNTTMFSPCSVGNICKKIIEDPGIADMAKSIAFISLGSAIGSTLNSTCLYTPGNVTVISLKECGNGILEPGEECDPGAGSSSACCDTTTCKLRPGALCDPGNSPCCTSTCQYAPNSTVCRPAISSQCDIPESCTGGSPICPADKMVADGTSCGSSGLACASGYCTSKNQQCANLGSGMNITQACNENGDTLVLFHTMRLSFVIALKLIL